MKKNFDKVLTGLDGEPVKENGKEVTLRTLIVNSLIQPFEDEKNLSADEKVLRGQLAEKIYPGGEIDVTPEEIVLMKKLVGKGYTALPVLRIFRFFDA